MPRRRGDDQGRKKAEPRTRPTINDVARLAHVSKKTVSRVINNSPFVRAATRDRIGAIISEIGFSPDPQARGLAFRRSFLIGLLCDDPLPANVGEMQQSILDALRGTGFELLIRAFNLRDAKFLSEVQTFVEGQRLFGVLLASALPRETGLSKLLRELDIPHAEIIAADRAGAAAASLIAATRPSAP
jgi:LacI family transcriptional regulator